MKNIEFHAFFMPRKGQTAIIKKLIILRRKQIMTTNEFHAGNLVRAELTSQNKSIVWLANEVHRSPSCMYRMLKKKYLNMKTFIEICVALDVNLCGCFCEDIERKII